MLSFSKTDQYRSANCIQSRYDQTSNKIIPKVVKTSMSVNVDIEMNSEGSFLQTNCAGPWKDIDHNLRVVIVLPSGMTVMMP